MKKAVKVTREEGVENGCRLSNGRSKTIRIETDEKFVTMGMSARNLIGSTEMLEDGGEVLAELNTKLIEGTFQSVASVLHVSIWWFLLYKKYF